MIRLRTTVIALLLLVSAAVARAQDVGVRAGVSGDPDQFYVGIHGETGELAERLHFRPNMELGVGDDITLVALNFEFAYHFGYQRGHNWGVYAGGGPALNVYRFRSDSDAQGGFNILLGVEHRRGLFGELKVGAIDSPSVKVGMGYTFR